jgi:NADH:ubiquinone oxidoreductase subunit C
MDTAEALLRAEELLKPFAQTSSRPTPERLDVMVLPSALVATVRALVRGRWGYLLAITGVDHPGETAPTPEDKQWARLARDEEEAPASTAAQEGSVEILYHFCQKAAVVTLRVSVRYSFPVIHTICDCIPSATLYERELIEMFGVKVVGTPNKERLLLPNEWPDGAFPLRKSFKSLEEFEAPVKES